MSEFIFTILIVRSLLQTSLGATLLLYSTKVLLLSQAPPRVVFFYFFLQKKARKFRLFSIFLSFFIPIGGIFLCFPFWCHLFHLASMFLLISVISQRNFSANHIRKQIHQLFVWYGNYSIFIAQETIHNHSR